MGHKAVGRRAASGQRPKSRPPTSTTTRTSSPCSRFLDVISSADPNRIPLRSGKSRLWHLSILSRDRICPSGPQCPSGRFRAAAPVFAQLACRHGNTGKRYLTLLSAFGQFPSSTRRPFLFLPQTRRPRQRLHGGSTSSARTAPPGPITTGPCACMAALPFQSAQVTIRFGGFPEFEDVVQA